MLSVINRCLGVCRSLSGRGSSVASRQARHAMFAVLSRPFGGVGAAQQLCVRSLSASAPCAAAMAPDSRRTGVLAIKCGMTREWDSWGVAQPLTVLKARASCCCEPERRSWAAASSCIQCTLQVDNCQVTQVKTADKEGYTALQARQLAHTHHQPAAADSMIVGLRVFFGVFRSASERRSRSGSPNHSGVTSKRCVQQQLPPHQPLSPCCPHVLFPCGGASFFPLLLCGRC